MLAMGLTSVHGLESILIGSITGCDSNEYGPDYYVLFMSSPTCGEGTDFGPINFSQTELWSVSQ